MPVDYHGIPVVARQHGFLAYTGIVLDDDKPVDVSEQLWATLSDAERAGCNWVLFDRDEPE